MEISFKGPVMPIDPYSQLAFVEILNIILIAKHIMDVNRYLIARNVNPQFGSLSGYFRWSFADERFTLWQRTDYNSRYVLLTSHIGYAVLYACSKG